MQPTILRQFIKDFRTALAQASNNNAAQLAKGQCATFEEYKAKVGFIKGLEAADALSDQLLRAYEDAARADQGDLPEMQQ